jgi:hypothetical protein
VAGRGRSTGTHLLRDVLLHYLRVLTSARRVRYIDTDECQFSDKKIWATAWARSLTRPTP